MLSSPLGGELAKTGAAATNEDLDIGPVPAGEEWAIEHLSAEDETTAFTTLRVGILRSLSFMPLEEQASPSAATLYWNSRPFYLREHESLRVRFTGTTNADKLRAYYNGTRRRVS